MNLRRPPGAAPAAASRLPAAAADDITERRRKAPRWSGPGPPGPRPPAAPAPGGRTRAPALGPAAVRPPRPGRLCARVPTCAAGCRAPAPRAR